MVRWQRQCGRLKIKHSIKVSQAEEHETTYLGHMRDAQLHGNASECYQRRFIDPGVDVDTSRHDLQMFVEHPPPFYTR